MADLIHIVAEIRPFCVRYPWFWKIRKSIADRVFTVAREADNWAIVPLLEKQLLSVKNSRSKMNHW